MPRYLPIQIINATLIQRNIEILSDYTGVRNIASFKCLLHNCGYVWQALAHSVMHNDAGCPNCMAHRRAQEKSPIILCNQCNRNPIKSGCKRCAQCIEQQKQQTKQRIEEGKCVMCGNLRDNLEHKHYYCTKCLEERREYDGAGRKRRGNERKANGLCIRCGKHSPLNETTLCENCWWSSKRNKGVTATIAQLKELWNKQDGKCAITGLPLVIGSTSAIDHIIPKSKGGSTTIENLQWTMVWANNMKHDNSLDELIEHCRIIIDFHISKNCKKAA